MKRFWLVMLSLGLVLAFSASAMAVDVKFSGSFYAAGMYLDKTNFRKDSGSDGISTAFYYQRLRVQTEFIASPGLSLITRFDAMERAWGAPRSTPGTAPDWPASMGTAAENENIAFDYAYIQYISPIGIMRAGAGPGGTWGTVFGDTSSPAWRWQLSTLPLGNFQFTAIVEKKYDNSYSAKNPTAAQADKDQDIYYLGGLYRGKQFVAGILTAYQRAAENRSPAATSRQIQAFGMAPYFQAQIGPVKIEGELDYFTGSMRKYDDPGNTDMKLNSLAGYLNAVADFQQFYVGGTFAYVQGQGNDPNTFNVLCGGGLDWSPTLIMFNEDRAQWVGSLTGYTNTSFTNVTGNGGMQNAWFYQVKGGVRPTDKVDISASLSHAYADTLTTLVPYQYGSNNKTYGYEIDVVGTYKITNNLSYMLGVGYLFTGDYLKGTAVNASVKDNYLVINKLTLTF